MKRIRPPLGRRLAWDEAGRRDPLYYVATERRDWEVSDFFASGEALLKGRIDPWLTKRELDPRSSTALEIGAGVGRLSRGLSHRFAEVIALDIAPSMVAKGQELNSDRPNLKFTINTGDDLTGVASGSCDFILCVWVFQHIPNLETIEKYIREIARALKSDGSFVLQIQASRFPWPYAKIRNYLVSTGRWTKLIAPFTEDATLAAAFPGVLLGRLALRKMCSRNQLTIIETAADEVPAAYWIYGEKVKQTSQ